jgi:hypothetical protein
MSDKDTDRRTLIAAAAAAGVAAAGSAKAFNPQPEPPGRRLPTQIKVDLGGVHLPEGIARELESQINRDVLGALARAGIKGNVAQIGPRPGWYGIIWRPVNLPNAAGGPG